MYKLPPVTGSNWMRIPLIAAIVLVALVLGNPAGAITAKLFTIDGNSNDVNDLDGSDDLNFSFAGSTGTVSGSIRAVDITSINRAALTADIAFYVDFLGNFPGGADLTQMDTLIFDVVLNAGSAPIDELGIAVGTVPLALDPDGAGYFDPCTPGVPLGCRSNVPVGQTPDAISLTPGGAFFPGGVLFGFGKGTDSAANLEAGETSIRMFVAWEDFGSNGAPLSRIDMAATFMLSSGINGPNLTTDIVPEPGTGILLGVGLVLLAAVRNRRQTT